MKMNLQEYSLVMSNTSSIMRVRFTKYKSFMWQIRFAARVSVIC